MRKVIAFTNLTLDGVMQAPGRPDEDTRDGFEHGGWAAPYAAMQEVGGGMMNTGGLLLGRRTYEDFYSFWPHQTDNPFTTILENTQKYVVSTTLKEPLPWRNSTLIQENVAESVNKLKQEPDKDLLILGSGQLIQSLTQHNLINEYMLLIHPLVLGTGRRLFIDDGASVKLQLTNSQTTSKGVVIATYQPLE